MILSANLRGILAMVLAMGAFIGSDSATKFVIVDLPVFEVVFLRGIAAVTLCAALVFAWGHGRDLMLMFNPLLLARGICEVGANFSFTVAILHVPIAEVTAIIQTCPLLVLAGAKLFYGENLGFSRLLLIALGITGALLVAQPGAPSASPYVLLGFVTALSAAARDLITRKVPGHIPAPVVAFAVLVLLMLASEGAMLAFETPVLPNATQLALIFLAAALMVAGHVLIFLAYKLAGARTIAPFMYTLTLWAVLSGFVLFGDYPNILAMAGMALILLAGLIVVYADGRRRNGRVRAS